MSVVKLWISKIARRVFGAYSVNGIRAGEDSSQFTAYESSLQARRADLSSQRERLQADIVAQLAKGDKALAVQMALRRQMIEKEIDVLDGLIFKIHSLIFSIDSARSQGTAMNAISQLGAKQQQVHKEFNLDYVKNTMSKVDQVEAMSSRISDVLMNPKLREPAITRDLDMLEVQLVNEKLNCMAKIPCGQHKRDRSCNRMTSDGDVLSTSLVVEDESP